MKGMLALGRMKAGKLNKTEQAYAEHLEWLKQMGEIQWHAFEAVTLKLADDTRYTPDFIVMASSGQLEAHEVKGFFRDDAKVKLKVAADKFPFVFLLVRAKPKREGGGWDIQEV